MARRGKSQARRQNSKGTPAWAWLLMGLFVGALAYFGYQQYLAYKNPVKETIASPQPTAGKSTNEKSIEPPASGINDGVVETDYSFYEVLPTQETVDVEVDSETAKSDKDAVASTPPVVAENTKEPVADKAIEPTKIVESDNASYLLQAGSFESNADAENLKARIALSGEPARVEEAQVDGKTMYRVRLGPYENTQAASAAQSALASQGINANRIKIK